MSNSLIAKPIVKDQYWLITDGNQKVGNVSVNNLGYTVTINGYNKTYTNKQELQKQTKITFQKLVLNLKHKVPYDEYPTTARVFNSIMDIKKKVHLYTKTKKSKCYYVAGWFVMEQNDVKKVMFCPKYIFVQRYNYFGPYKTKHEAEEQLNKLCST